MLLLLLLLLLLHLPLPLHLRHLHLPLLLHLPLPLHLLLLLRVERLHLRVAPGRLLTPARAHLPRRAPVLLPLVMPLLPPPVLLRRHHPPRAVLVPSLLRAAAGRLALALETTDAPRPPAPPRVRRHPAPREVGPAALRTPRTPQDPPASLVMMPRMLRVRLRLRLRSAPRLAASSKAWSASSTGSAPRNPLCASHDPCAGALLL